MSIRRLTGFKGEKSAATLSIHVVLSVENGRLRIRIDTDRKESK